MLWSYLLVLHALPGTEETWRRRRGGCRRLLLLTCAGCCGCAAACWRNLGLRTCACLGRLWARLGCWSSNRRLQSSRRNVIASRLCSAGFVGLRLCVERDFFVQQFSQLAIVRSREEPCQQITAPRGHRQGNGQSAGKFVTGNLKRHRPAQENNHAAAGGETFCIAH